LSWTADEVVRELKAAGFVLVRQNATSHAVYRHPDGRQTTISMHRGDIKAGTLGSIRRQTGLPFRK